MIEMNKLPHNQNVIDDQMYEDEHQMFSGSRFLQKSVNSLRKHLHSHKKHKKQSSLPIRK